MAWTLNISPVFDWGEYYSAGYVALNGSIFSPPNPGGGGAPLDTVTSTAPPSFLSLPFPSAASPPTAAGTVLVTDSVTAGDLVRSGTITAFPASPASAAVVTFPSVTISANEVQDAVDAWVAQQGVSLRPTAVPYEIRLASGLLTAGTSIPLVVSPGKPTAELGDGTLTLKVPVSVAVRTFWFFVRTYDLMLTLTYTLGPRTTRPCRPASSTSASRVKRLPAPPGRSSWVRFSPPSSRDHSKRRSTSASSRPPLPRWRKGAFDPPRPRCSVPAESRSRKAV